MVTGRENTPLLLNSGDSARLLGISRATFWKWHANGLLGPEPIRRGGVVRWVVGELEAWVQAGMPARVKWQQEREILAARA